MQNRVALVIGIIGLIISILTGYIGSRITSHFTVIMLAILWTIWITIKILKIEKVQKKYKKNDVDVQGEKKEFLKIPYKPIYQFLDTKIHSINQPEDEIKIPADFLDWDKFTLVFWVKITQDFLDSKNNRYIFSYKSKTEADNKYRNAFYLGIIKSDISFGDPEWKLTVGGENFENQKNINFRSNNLLLGWKLFSVTWRKYNGKLEFLIDDGTTYNNTLELNYGFFPKFSKNEPFTLGGWATWDGGLSYLNFYNFRVFKSSLTLGDISNIFEYEKHRIGFLEK